ncbi:zinc finger BED domain-containing protein DAYSLEEPER-like [Nicotiana sylvestris]|uniref:zinc finger BED domain-containing protein DAYSLEEPER-like n=1 Tax=Nicotiana sylvestris TaxID=4096 RepID=UPI00388CB711
MAHILHLIVQDGLKELDASVTRVRNIMRWNSTYLMLDTAQNFEKAFDKFHLFDDGFSAYECSHLCKYGSTAGPLESDDWVNVRNAIEFLARFHELTKKYHLKKCLVSEDEHLRKMAERMQEKIKKYWDGALEELFGEEKGKKINAEVYAYMNSLFEEYLTKYSTGSCPQSPSSSTSSNNTFNTSSGSIITASLIRTKLHLKKQKEDNGSGAAKLELDKYFSEEQEPFSEEFYILNWRREEKNPISVEEDLKYLEELELGSSAIMPLSPKVRSHIWEHFEVKMSKSVNAHENNGLENHGENDIAIPGIGVPP